MKISIIIIITLSITSLMFAATSAMSIPKAFSQLSDDDDEEEDRLFLLRARIIVDDQNTEQVEIKFKSDNVAQQEVFEKSENSTSKKFKFRFNEAFKAPYEICAESVQNKDVYSCKGGLLHSLKPNVTLHL